MPDMDIVGVIGIIFVIVMTIALFIVIKKTKSRHVSVLS